MVRDKPRDRLASNEVWNMVDYIPDLLGAPLRKRGGWEYHGPTLNSLNASATQPFRVAVAPFTSGTQVIAIDSVPRLYDLTNSADRGAVNSVLAGPPVFYRNLLILPGGAGANAQKYTGSGAPATLGGTPPKISTMAVYKDRLVVSSGDVPNRIFFSGAGNPESWDTSLRWIDASDVVIALAPLRNALLVFHPGSVERIRGAIPPGSAAANMELEALFGTIGAGDNTSVAVSDELAYFADDTGVYETDGASLTNLTRAGGIETYYRSVIASATVVLPVLTVWRGYLFVCCMDLATELSVTTLVCQIKNRSWFNLSHIPSFGFASVFSGNDELYFANRDTSSKQVGKLSGIWSPTSGTNSDADGTVVAPYIETAYYDGGSFYLKQFGDLYLNYDITEVSGSSNPKLRVHYVTDPSATSYTQLTDEYLETTVRKRGRGRINLLANGLAFKIEQINASVDTRIYGIEADVEEQEGSHLA